MELLKYLNFVKLGLEFTPEDFKATQSFAAEYIDVPIFAVTGYLMCVFWLPDYISTPFHVKNALRLWNLLLTVFSGFGMYFMLPHLWSNVWNNGVKYTVCTTPDDWYGSGPPAFWVMVFCFSKAFEFLDTLFLVLQKKNVIFLHWFHHVTVMLYCWHAYMLNIPPGIWFGTINYIIHTVMYGYYFVTSIGLYKLARPIAPIITFLQIAQMVVGSAITVMAYYYHTTEPENCAGNRANYKMGLAMYFSYFVLFSVLFLDKYLKPKADTKGNKTKNICSVSEDVDSAGMFRDQDNEMSGEAQSKKKKN